MEVKIDRELLREQIDELRLKLARMEEMQRRQDRQAWREFQRERGEAIKVCEQISQTLSRKGAE